MAGIPFQHLSRAALGRLATGPGHLRTRSDGDAADLSSLVRELGGTPPKPNLGDVGPRLQSRRPGRRDLDDLTRGAPGGARHMDAESRAVVGAKTGTPGNKGRGTFATGEITDLQRLPQDVRRAAAEASQRVQHGDDIGSLTEDQRRGLEAVVAISGRPSWLMKDGFVALPVPADWKFIEGLEAKVREAAQSVGRINVSRGLLPYAGTGFMVSDDVLMTNRHVAEVFCEPSDDKRSPGGWRIRPPYRPRIDFLKEYPTSDPKEFEITGVLHVDSREDVDLALLRVARRNDKGLELPPALKLTRTVDVGQPGDQVYNIGYPAFDPEADYEVLSRIFGTAYRVKRLAPGEIRDASDLKQALTTLRPGDLVHDCSTLGGCSGSIIMHFDTERVIGLHYYGTQFVGNQAVHLAKLAGEPMMKDLNFDG